MSKRLLPLLLIAVGLSQASAQTWKVNANGNWNSTANWNPGTVPNSNTANVTLGTVINAARTISLGGGSFTLPTLTINNTAGSYTVGSTRNDGTLNFQAASGSAGIFLAAPTATINSTVHMNGSTTFSANAGDVLTVNGAITEAFFSKLFKYGAGTVVLSGTNTFTGGFDVEGGILEATTNSSLGASSNPTVANGATLALSGGVTIAEAFMTLTGSGGGGAGVIESMAGSANTLNASGYTFGTSLINTVGNLTMTGQITANGDITHTGAGTLTLGGPFFGTGDLIQDAVGDLTLAGGNNFGGGGLVVNAGNVNLNLSGGLVQTTTSIGGAGSTASVTMLADNQFATYETATIGAQGTLNLNGHSNTLASVTMDAGTINTGSGTLTLSSATPLTTVASATGSTVTGNLTVTAFNPTLSVANGSASSDLTINGQLTASSGFTKSGSGVLTLTGNQANVTGGTVTVAQGTLALNKSGGAAAISAGSVAINSGGTLLIEASNQIANTVGITLNGGILTVQAGSDTVGALTLSANSTIDMLGAATTLIFANSSALTWSGALTILDWTATDFIGFGTGTNGLTAAQLADISFDIGGVLKGAQILANGEIVPVPELPKIFAAILLVAIVVTKGLLDFRQRRRAQRDQNSGNSEQELAPLSSQA